jgi:hypothetical protein
MQRNKRLDKARNNPKEVTFEELVALLQAYGFEVRNYSGGSHYTVWHPRYQVIQQKEPNSIPRRKPHLLPVYVKRALTWIERVQESEKEHGGTDETL